VFSALLNPESRIGEILFNNQDKLEFYTCKYLRVEINKHIIKLHSLSGKSEEDLMKIIYRVYTKIIFIEDAEIPYEFWVKAAPLVREIDMDDLPFVALNEYLNGHLWTGDKKLMNGLIERGYHKCIDTQDIIKIIEE